MKGSIHLWPSTVFPFQHFLLSQRGNQHGLRSTCPHLRESLVKEHGRMWLASRGTEHEYLPPLSICYVYLHGDLNSGPRACGAELYLLICLPALSLLFALIRISCIWCCIGEPSVPFLPLKIVLQKHEAVSPSWCHPIQLNPSFLDAGGSCNLATISL